MGNQSISNWVRQPASIVLIIALAIMIVMFVDQSRQQPDSAATTAAMQASTPASDKKVIPARAVSPQGGSMGGEMPKIVQRLGGSMTAQNTTQPEQLNAPDLGSLLGRMEEKVRAEPENINNRLLLAQTYNELGLADKAITEARTAMGQQPDHARAQLVLGSILSKRKGETDLNEALELLKNLRSNSDVKQYLVEMYLGDAWIRLGDHQSAMVSWQKALDGMPVTDNRRAAIEKGIADISAGNPGG